MKTYGIVNIRQEEMRKMTGNFNFFFEISIQIDFEESSKSSN